MMTTKERDFHLVQKALGGDSKACETIYNRFKQGGELPDRQNSDGHRNSLRPYNGNIWKDIYPFTPLSAGLLFKYMGEPDSH